MSTSTARSIILARRSTMLSALFNMISPQAILRGTLGVVPSILKYTLALLLLINVRSFPLAWHVRVWAPAIRLHVIYRLLRLRLFFAPKKVRDARLQDWLDSLSPLGVSPLDFEVVHRSWASPDDCDFNLHLSNSCYPKVLDQARLKAALAMCPSFFRHGGWIALGATHHHFLREIPMFASYEVRMKVGAWDNKWMYIIIRFVTHPKKSKSRSARPASKDDAAPAALPALHTPATPLDSSDASGAATPASDSGDEGARAAALARAHAHLPERDGATVHCVAVSVMCFKHGRITVPPALVLAGDGLCAPPPPGAAAYSRAHPPPHWVQHAQAARSQAQTKAYKALIRGGWKSAPEGERWWDAALAGVEEERKRRLGLVEGVRKGMEGARECI